MLPFPLQNAIMCKIISKGKIANCNYSWGILVLAINDSVLQEEKSLLTMEVFKLVNKTVGILVAYFNSFRIPWESHIALFTYMP